MLCYNNRVKSVQNQRKLSDWESFGQSGAKQLLNRLLTASTPLPHAFLFFGPKGIGKYQLASEFANKIGVRDNVTSELYEFDFELDNGLAELRELLKLSSLTAAASGKKIFLLRNFHLASLAGVNSLLKTLEEPTTDTMFLLVSNGNSALPTIISRVVPVRCFPVNEAVSKELPADLARSLQGFPNLRSVYTEDSAASEEMAELLKDLQTAATQQSALVLSNKLADLDSVKLQTLLQLWTNRLKHSISEANLVTSVASIRAAQTAVEDLTKNYNTKLVLQQFLQNTKL